VLTLEIVLEDVQPRVWRLIEVPSTFTFFDLHSAIIDAMGWQDAHLHEFTIGDPRAAQPLRIGLPNDEFPDERPAEPGWTVPIAGHLAPGRSVHYVYDFGDDWRHRVTCLAETPPAQATKYPRCLDGARACPPEDVVGPPGYFDFLAAASDPHHKEHHAVLRWAGGVWDAERFSPQTVRFKDPRHRLRRWREG
jgi:hypothetical protein